MKNYALASILTAMLFFNNSKSGMAQFYNWGHTTQSITAQTVDGNGNTYTFGNLVTLYEGSNPIIAPIDIHPDTGKSFIITEDEGNQFVQKFDFEGNLIWAGQFGITDYPFILSEFSPASRVLAANTDEENNVYFANRIDHSINFRDYGFYDANPDTSDVAIDSIELTNTSIVLTKLDEHGNLAWAVNYPDGVNPGTNRLDQTFKLNTFEINAIETDQDGNVYVSGSYLSAPSADFDPGPGEALLSSMPNLEQGVDGSTSGYVVKYDKNGIFKWVVEITGGGHSSGVSIDDGNLETDCYCDQTTDMVVDDSGNVLISGFVTLNRGLDRLDLNPGKNTEDTFYVDIQDKRSVRTTSTRYNTTDYFMKLDSLGQFKWVKVFNDSSSDSRPSIEHVFLNAENEVYLTGLYEGTNDFDLDTGVSYLTSVSKNHYLLKLAANGSFQWVKPLTPYTGKSVVRRGYSGKFYISSYHTLSNTTDYNLGTGTASLSGNFFTDLNSDPIVNSYISSFDENGDFLWIKGIEQLNLSRNTSIDALMDLDPYDNMIVSSNSVRRYNLSNGIEGYIDIDPSVNDTVRLTFPRTTDRSGVTGYTFKWSLIDCDSSTATSGDTTIAACNFYVGPSGKIYDSSGIFIDTSLNTIGCDSFLTVNLTITESPIDTIDVSACSRFYVPDSSEFFSTSGEHSYLISNANGCDTLIVVNLTILNTSSLVYDTACVSYMSPSGRKIWDSSGLYRDTITNFSGCDSFMLIDLTIVQPTEAVSEVTSCIQYTAPSGRYTWTESGNYKDTITNQVGCDSVLNIKLTVLKIDKQVDSQRLGDGIVLSAREDFSSYQWLDCANSFAPINKETKQSFTTIVSGSYAVSIAREDGCKDTTDCIEVEGLAIDDSTDVSIAQLSRNSIIQVYPNPTLQFVNISSIEKELVRMQLTTLTGKVILDDTFTQKTQLDLRKFQAGIYLLSIETSQRTWHTRVIKE